MNIALIIIPIVFFLLIIVAVVLYFIFSSNRTSVPPMMDMQPATIVSHLDGFWSHILKDGRGSTTRYSIVHFRKLNNNEVLTVLPMASIPDDNETDGPKSSINGNSIALYFDRDHKYTVKFSNPTTLEISDNGQYIGILNKVKINSTNKNVNFNGTWTNDQSNITIQIVNDKIAKWQDGTGPNEYRLYTTVSNDIIRFDIPDKTDTTTLKVSDNKLMFMDNNVVVSTYTKK